MLIEWHTLPTQKLILLLSVSTGIPIAAARFLEVQLTETKE